MFLGALSIELYICESGSLKSKRQVLKALKDRIKANFNVSVSEVGDLEKWQLAQLGIACVGQDKQYINGILDKVMDLIRKNRQIQLIDMQMEIW